MERESKSVEMKKVEEKNSVDHFFGGDVLKMSAKYVAPEIKDYVGIKWVLNGEGNKYFKYVQDRRYGSPTNSAIINNYIKLIYGLGLFDKNGLNLENIISKSDVMNIVDDFYTQNMFAFFVQKNRKGELLKLIHCPIDKVAPQFIYDNQKITTYYFSEDWKNPYMHDSIPIPYKSFGYGDGYETELQVYKPYQLQSKYFALPSYQAALQYAQIEEEISNFSLNHILNGFSTGMIMSIPNSSSWSNEKKKEYAKKVEKKLTGSNAAGGVVCNFMEGDGSESSGLKIEVPQISDAHKNWESMREQAREQILTGHEVVSPLLFGIDRGSGLSSTADELEEAEKQTMKRVIRPIQEQITNNLMYVINSITELDVDLYFKPLSELENNGKEKKETQLKSEDEDPLNDKVAKILIRLGIDDSELIDFELKVVEKVEDAEEVVKLASTGTARPRAVSEQDTENIIVRYRYSPQSTSQNSREFCRLMVSANKLYRKEDIEQMESIAVNPGLGKGGSNTYSIWKYKGGARCHHFWQREIYVKKGFKVDPNSPLAEKISANEARRQGYKLEQNNRDVAKRPIDMPNEGFAS